MRRVVLPIAACSPAVAGSPAARLIRWAIAVANVVAVAAVHVRVAIEVVVVVDVDVVVSAPHPEL